MADMEHELNNLWDLKFSLQQNKFLGIMIMSTILFASCKLSSCTIWQIIRAENLFCHCELNHLTNLTFHFSQKSILSKTFFRLLRRKAPQAPACIFRKKRRGRLPAF